MNGFYHIWAWRLSWSCDLDFAIKLEMPLPKEAPHNISTRSAKRFQRRRSLKLWTMTDDGRTPDHGHPISSPCEPSDYIHQTNMSRPVGQPTICIGKNKGADQLRGCEADQHLCFRYTDRTLPFLLKSKISSF